MRDMNELYAWLETGMAIVNLLLAYSLWSKSQFYFFLVLSTGVVQILTSLREPKNPRWHRFVCIFNIMWPGIMSSLLNTNTEFQPCDQVASPLLFWTGMIIDSSFPWLILNSLVYSVEWPLAISTNLLATLALIPGNFKRASTTMADCPIAKEMFSGFHSFVSRYFGFFFCDHLFKPDLTIETANLDQLFIDCFVTYTWIQLCGYVIAISLLWNIEHAKRISFLQRRSDDQYIDIEVRLEEMATPQLTSKIYKSIQVLVACVLLFGILNTFIQSILLFLSL